jgi:hypothetical protein
MKQNREAYEDLADRAVRLLAAVADTVSKTNLEKLKGIEGNLVRLLLCVLDRIIHPTVAPDVVGQHTPRHQTGHRGTPEHSYIYGKAQRCEEACAIQGQSCPAHSRGSGSDQKARITARPRGGRIECAHPRIVKPTACAYPGDQVTSLVRMKLVVEDVRALTEFLMRRIGEMNHELSRASMNGAQSCS